MNRRSFIRTLIGATAAAPLAPLAAFAAPHGYAWVCTLHLVDFGDLIPPINHLLIKLPIDATAEEARLMANRCLWEAWLAREMRRIAP